MFTVSFHWNTEPVTCVYSCLHVWNAVGIYTRYLLGDGCYSVCSARLGIKNIQHKALTDTPCHYDSGRTTLTDTSYTRWGCALGRVVIGLSAVLWISIPATASMVGRKE